MQCVLNLNQFARRTERGQGKAVAFARHFISVVNLSVKINVVSIVEHFDVEEG